MPTSPKTPSQAAAHAYGQVQVSGMKGRGLEAAAFVKAASLLSQAQDRAGDPTLLAEALEFNQKLWTILQAAASDETDPMPDDVKRDLLSLSMFVDRATAEALARPLQPQLSALIEINRNLAAGLMPD